MGHKIADADSLGACMGIYRAAVELEKKAHVVINEVTTSVRPLYDEIAESPAYGKDIFLTSEQALDYITDSTMVIVVDTNKPQDVYKRQGYVRRVCQRYKSGKNAAGNGTG